MQMTKPQIAIVGTVAAIFLLLGLALIFGRKSGPVAPPPKTQINFWGFKADESAWKNVIDAYSAANPTVNVTLTSVDPANYEATLIDSLAAGTGPDVFMFYYDWLTKHKNKILPAPATITPDMISNLFPKAVAEDFVSDSQVYALPVSINTLALAYNRDYFDAKGVPNPPASWEDIKSMIPKLRELNNGKIVKSAISIGGSEDGQGHIKNADDILTLMLLQNGVNILGNPQNGGGIESQPGIDTLNSYLDFSNPSSKNFAFYSGTTENSLDAFANGDTAMVFVYPQDLQYIKSKNPVLNYKVVPMLQLNPNKAVNLTDYWGLAVSNRTASHASAWSFISFAAMNEAMAKTYASTSQNQPALRSVIASFNPDPILGVFAPQALNAVSFPKNNRDGFRAIIDNMIESSLKDRSNVAAAAATADAGLKSAIQK